MTTDKNATKKTTYFLWVKSSPCDVDKVILNQSPRHERKVLPCDRWFVVLHSRRTLGKNQIIQPAREARGPEGPARWQRQGC